MRRRKLRADVRADLRERETRDFCGVVVALGVFVTLVCSLFAPASFAEPVLGDIFTFTQPDGSRVEVRVWGDEFYRVVESLDGYTLVRDPNSNEICYARLSADGERLVSTGTRVDRVTGDTLELKKHIRINPESRRAIIQEAREGVFAYELGVQARLGLPPEGLAPPNNGNVQGICLIVDFSDEVATIPASEIDNYCNMVGYTGYGNNGSVRDYFFDVSDGNLTYTNYVPSAYYRAQYPKTYYDDCSTSSNEKPRELILEALNDLENAGFDFSQYDSDGDGYIDAINCFYAGDRGCPWTYGLWPHSSIITFNADGVQAYRYQITDLGSSLRLSTFCHENGHMICYWPDLYDYGYESTGVGTFCLMCYAASTTNPQEPCAYLKDIAGWTTTNLLTSPQAGIAVPSNANTIYKYEHPTLSNEYYLLENRQQAGRDSALPDAGIAIWHIDTTGDNDNEQMTPTLHYEATLVQADGNWDLENDVNYGDATDLWAAPGYVECTPTTSPNTKWWSGNSSGLSISNVSSSSTAMTFDFNIAGTTCDWYIKPDGTGDAATIQDAIDLATAGDTICLATGTYTGMGNRAITLKDSVVVRSESGDPDSCIIDCERLSQGFSVGPGVGPSTVLKGITVTNGYAVDGAAMRCEGSPTIIDCKFIENTATSTAGGIYFENGSAALLQNCVFDSDSAYGGSGGAVRVRSISSAPTFEKCVFTNNWAGGSGGAVVCAEASPVFRGCTFYGNMAPTGSGFLFRLSSSTTIDSTIISFGSAGLAIHCESPQDASTFTISCTNIYGNAGGDWAGCIVGMDSTNGNVSVDPFFCDASTGDLTLRGDSECLPANNSCGVLMGVFGEGCVAPPTVAHWNFNEMAGDTVHDISGNGNHGVASGGVSWDQGCTSGALRFDGIDGKVVVPHSSHFEIAEGTVEVIMRPHGGLGAADGKETLIQKHAIGNFDGDFQFYFSGINHLLEVEHDFGTVHQWIRSDPGTTPFDDVWYHVAYVFDASGMRMYLDGVLQAHQLSTPVTWLNNSWEMSIGLNTAEAGIEGFEGRIDEIRITNRALSPGEFLTCEGPSDIVASWDFDEAAGDTAYDQSGNGHDGYRDGASWVAGVCSGSALEYDGIDDYFAVPGGLWLTQTKGTMEAWIWIDPAETGARVISTETAGWHDGFHIGYGHQLSNNDSVYSAIIGGIHSTEGGNHHVETYVDSVSTGEWHFMAFVWDADADYLMAFVDGDTNSVVSPHHGIEYTGERLTIGCWEVGATRGSWFEGSVDRVRFYNTALNIDTLNAHYNEISHFTLTANVVGNGAITRTPDRSTYLCGDTVIVEAVPDSGWTFDGWSGDLSGTENPDTVVMTSDATITATFSSSCDICNGDFSQGETCWVNESSGPGLGSGVQEIIDVDGRNDVLHLDSRAGSNYYLFRTQTIPTCDVQDKALSWDWKLEQIEGSYGLAAVWLEFKNSAGDTLGRYYVRRHTGDFSPYDCTNIINELCNITAPGDGVGCEELAGTSFGWTTETLHFTAAFFANLDCAPIDPADVASIKIWIQSYNNAGAGVDAYFDNFAYYDDDLNTLTVNVIGNGTVTKTPDQPVYGLGESVIVEAVPDANWTFSGWSDGLSGTENPDTIVMLSDTTITATFMPGCDICNGDFSLSETCWADESSGPGLGSGVAEIIDVDGRTDVLHLDSRAGSNYYLFRTQNIATCGVLGKALKWDWKLAQIEPNYGLAAVWLEFMDDTDDIIGRYFVRRHTGDFPAYDCSSIINELCNITAPGDGVGCEQLTGTSFGWETQTLRFTSAFFSTLDCAPIDPAEVATIKIWIQSYNNAGAGVDAYFDNFIYEDDDSYTVTVATDPIGLEVLVDSVAYTAPRQFVSVQNAFHHICVDNSQEVVNTDTILVFSDWSDGGARCHTIVVPDSNVTYTANFTVQTKYASIDSIVDIPDDQGGWVRIHFARSGYDSAEETDYPIATYNVWRRVDVPATAQSVISEGKPLTPEEMADLDGGLLKNPELLSHLQLIEWQDRYFYIGEGEQQSAELPPGTWEILGSFAAAQLEHYIYAAATLGNASDTTIAYTAYAISAHSTAPTEWFMSPPDSGYSIDNLVPEAPQGFSVSYNGPGGNLLGWDESADEDFSHYAVYRGLSGSAAQGPQATEANGFTLVHTTTETSWLDGVEEGWRYIYELAAVDLNGNESTQTGPDNLTGVEMPRIPDKFALHQNAPNPFNPSTVIRYDVPAGGGRVSLQVYDVSGQLIRTFVDGNVTPGRKTVIWDARDARGNLVSSGIYFYRLRAGATAITKKMVLLK